MSKHTPEPWVAYQNTSYWQIDDGNGKMVADTCASSAGAPRYGASMALGEANAKRIVSCVNACNGINPEAVHDLLASAKAVESLAYLSAVLPNKCGNRFRVALTDLRNAIAKAEGGAA